MVRINLARQDITGFLYAILFTALLTYGLAEKGLFFEPYRTYAATAAIAAGLVGLILLAIFRKFKVPQWLLLMYLYAGYTWLTTLWSADAELAVAGSLVVTAAVITASFVPQLSDKWRGTLLTVLAITPAVLYLYAMGTVFGWYRFQDAIQNGMMDSVFQYHNTFGTFSLAGAMIALVLGMLFKRYLAQFAFYFVACVDFDAVFASYSRWVWILSVVMLATFLIAGFTMRFRTRALLSGVLVVLASLVSGALAISAMHHTSLSDIGISLAIDIAGSAAIAILIRRILKLNDRKKRIVATVVTLAVPLVFAILAALVESKHLTSVAERIKSIRIGSSSLQARFWFYGAAVHMWENNPVFGSGAGSWTAKYMAYQQFPYISSMTHSVLFTELTNFGLLGTLLWISVIVAVAVPAIKTLRVDGDRTLYGLASLLAAGSLLIHSMMDFDMDFPTIFIVFVVLLALSLPSTTKSAVSGFDQRPLYGVKVPLFAALPLLLVLGLGLCISERSLTAAGYTANIDSKVALLKRAETYAPYVAASHAELAALYYNNYNASHSLNDRERAWQEAQYAAKTGRWNAGVQQEAANIAYNLGHAPQAYQWALRATNDAPFNITYSTAFAGMALWLGVEEATTNPQDAQTVFHSVIHSYNQASRNETYLKTVPSAVTTQWSANVQAYTTPAQLQVYAATAEYAIGNYRVSIADCENLAKQGQNYDTLGLYQLVTLLDEAKLGQGTIAQVPTEMQYRNPALTAEYNALVKIGSTVGQ